MKIIATHSLTSIGLCSVILTGCATDEIAPHAVDSEPQAQRVGQFDDVLDTVCTDKVHIARCTGDCDSFGPWISTQLFAEGTPWLDANLPPVPSALSGYYEFTWGAQGSPPQLAIDALYAQQKIETIGPSCLALSAQSVESVLTQALGPSLRDVFHAGTGRASSADLDLPSTGTSDPTVTVMVVDTQPDDFTVVPTSLHGRHMGNIISDIGCPEDIEGCRVEVDYVIGLPRVGAGQLNYVNGGIAGTHADLARALYEGLWHWGLANANRPIPSRLVINLSMGWEDAIFGGNDPVTSTAAVDAIQTVLKLASCEGALIVAAVGNESDFCDMSGPMLPSAWETLSAPTPLECDALGLPGSSAQTGDYQPLVHAVGGVDIDSSAMPGSRIDSTPRLVATAAHAVAGDPLHGGLTGTSVGAAVTTAAAALVWSHHPDLDASSVMDYVYDSGTSIPNTEADFVLEGGSGDVHHVNACAALDLVCGETPGLCPTLSLACTNAPEPNLDEVSLVLENLVSGGTESFPRSLPDTDSSCVDSCGTPMTVMVQANAVANCGAFAVDRTEHLINPTPDSIGCPTCAVQNNVLSLAVHPAFEGVDIESVFVKLIYDVAGTPVEYGADIGDLSLSPGVHTTVPLSPTDFPSGTVRSGEITLNFGMGRTTTDPLLVL